MNANKSDTSAEQFDDRQTPETTDKVVELTSSKVSQTTARDLNKRFADLERQVEDFGDQLATRGQQLDKVRKEASTQKGQVTRKFNTALEQIKALEQGLERMDLEIRNLGSEAASLAEQTEAAQEELKQTLESRSVELVASIDELNRQVQTARQMLDDELSELRNQVAQDLADAERESHARHQALEHQSEQGFASLRESDLQIRIEAGERAAALTAQIAAEGKRQDSALENAINALREADQEIRSDVERRDEAVRHSLDLQTARLGADLQQAERRIRQHGRQLDEHHATDQQLNRRTIALEGSTGRIGEQTFKLERAADKLERQSQHLLNAVVGLNDRTQELSDTSEAQGVRIHALDKRETGHFRLLGGGMLALAILGLGAYIYEKDLWQADTLHNQSLQQQLIQQKATLDANAEIQAGLQQQLAELQQRLANTRKQDIGELEREKAAMQQEIDQLQQRIQGMNDGVETLDGRLVNLRPNRQFGGDNTIHGAHWLAEQDPKGYALELGSFSEKQELYSLAERYSYRLKDKLSWYSTGNGEDTRYVLVYGQFDSKSDANRAYYQLHGLRQARVVRMAEIQGKL